MYQVINFLMLVFIVFAIEYEFINFGYRFHDILYWKQCFVALGVGIVIISTKTVWKNTQLDLP